MTQWTDKNTVKRHKKTSPICIDIAKNIRNAL